MPMELYVQNIDSALHTIGANGINGTLYDINGSVMITINNGQVIDKNAMFNGWNQPARPVIYYTKDGQLKLEKAKSTNDLSVPVKDILWGVGGGTPTTTAIRTENWGSDVTRPSAKRTALAIRNGLVYLIVTRQDMSLGALGNNITKALGNKAQPLFLDGGGSTQMYYYGSKVRSNRRVRNGIFIK